MCSNIVEEIKFRLDEGKSYSQLERWHSYYMNDVSLLYGAFAIMIVQEFGVEMKRNQIEQVMNKYLDMARLA